MIADDLMHRRKIITLSHDEVLQSVMKLNGSIDIIDHSELPEGYIVVSVHYDWQTRSFNFVIVHPSFDVVIPGVKAPYVESVFSMVTTHYKVVPVDEEENCGIVKA